MGRTKQGTSVGGEKDVQRCTARIKYQISNIKYGNPNNNKAVTDQE